MARIKKQCRLGSVEYIVLRKDDSPVLVEAGRIEEALGRGAESYPTICDSDYECWLEVPDEHMPKLKREMDRISA